MATRRRPARRTVPSIVSRNFTQVGPQHSCCCSCSPPPFLHLLVPQSPQGISSLWAVLSPPPTPRSCLSPSHPTTRPPTQPLKLRRLRISRGRALQDLSRLRKEKICEATYSPHCTVGGISGLRIIMHHSAGFEHQLAPRWPQKAPI